LVFPLFLEESPVFFSFEFLPLEFLPLDVLLIVFLTFSKIFSAPSFLSLPLLCPFLELACFES